MLLSIHKTYLHDLTNVLTKHHFRQLPVSAWYYRCALQRITLCTQLYTHPAFFVLQCYALGMLARREFRRRMHSIIKIQTHFRILLAKRKLRQLKIEVLPPVQKKLPKFLLSTVVQCFSNLVPISTAYSFIPHRWLVISEMLSEKNSWLLTLSRLRPKMTPWSWYDSRETNYFGTSTKKRNWKLQ